MIPSLLRIIISLRRITLPADDRWSSVTANATHNAFRSRLQILEMKCLCC